MINEWTDSKYLNKAFSTAASVPFGNRINKPNHPICVEIRDTDHFLKDSSFQH